jgi:hypothetical protein
MADGDVIWNRDNVGETPADTETLACLSECGLLSRQLGGSSDILEATRMNVFQAFNNALAGGFIAALLAGVTRSQVPLQDRSASFMLFGVFLCLIRLKIFFDDHKYFQTARTKNAHFKIGFVVGVSSWILWGFAALSVSSLQDSYFLAGAAILLSSIWIAVVAIRSGAYREQYIWMATNASYVLLLWTLHRRNGEVGDWVTWSLLAVLLAVLAFDWLKSDSVPELAE